MSFIHIDSGARLLRAQHKKMVRVLLVGDSGVGKTSLIFALISEEFPLEVPARSEDIYISENVTPEQVPTTIIDYSMKEQTDTNRNEQILEADVICIVYAVNDEVSLKRVTTYWLPCIREAIGDQPLKPVILAGNKIDIVDYSTVNTVYDIMQKYPEVESCIECSAKTLRNVVELFCYAQKTVLHPITPLYVPEKQDLTMACKMSLFRIFKICDFDGDNLLNDYEMNVFQKVCFNTLLQPHILSEVKSIIDKHILEGIYNNALTLKGFFFLHCLFIQRGHSETIWTVLRRFGYNGQLEISKDYLRPILKVPSGSCTELSHRGQKFLINLFERYRNIDYALSSDKHKMLFNICPIEPWSYDTDLCKSCPVSTRGLVNLNTWLCRWTLMTFLDVNKTIEYLGYLGYNAYENDTQLSAVHVTEDYYINSTKRQSSRSVYMCHVIGLNECDKNSICKAFLTQNTLPLISKESEMNTSVSHYINTIEIYGQEKYLILRDIDAKSNLDSLQPDEINCDVACLVFDTTKPHTFDHIARIYKRYYANDNTPVMIVGITETGTHHICYGHSYGLLQPSKFCDKYKLLPPQLFSLKDNNREIYVTLARMAAFQNYQEAWTSYRQPCGNWASLLKSVFGIAITSILGYFVKRTFQSFDTSAL